MGLRWEHLYYTLYGIYKKIKRVKTLRNTVFPLFIYPLRYFKVTRGREESDANNEMENKQEEINDTNVVSY